MTFFPFCSLNFTHNRSISPQSEFPTVPMASALANSPMFCGFRSASSIRFCSSGVIMSQTIRVSDGSDVNLVTGHVCIDFLGPGVQAPTQAADILEAVAHKVG